MVNLFNGEKWEWFDVNKSSQNLWPAGWFSSVEEYEKESEVPEKKIVDLPLTLTKEEMQTSKPAPLDSNDSNIDESERQERIELITEAISMILINGSPGDLNNQGKPNIVSIEDLVGFEVTSDERDKAYQDLIAAEEREDE